MLIARFSLAFVLAAAAGLATLGAAGPSLSLALGGFFIVAIVAPPLSIQSSFGQRAVISASAVAPLALIWFTLIGPAKATAAQWADLCALLAAFALFVAGLAALLEAMRVNPFVASATTVALTFAWLTWPVWLSRATVYPDAAQLMTHLVRYSPPLVANSILTFTPPWTEQTVAYQLTSLDQDLPINLPPSAIPAILAHLCVGGLCVSISGLLKRK